MILAQCPDLEDFAYVADPPPGSAFESGYIREHNVPIHNYLTEAHLEPLYPRLRRLCYSYLDKSFYSHKWARKFAKNIPDDMRVISDPDDFRNTYISLRSFQKLAILEIEHPFFDDTVIPDVDLENTDIPRPQRFLDALPATLQILHLGFVANWPNLYQDMTALADTIMGGENMPLLRIVHIGCVLPPPPEDSLELTRLLAKAGVTLSIGETPKGDNIRG